MATIVREKAKSKIERPRQLDHLVVATDGSPSAEPALRAARAITASQDVAITILGVHETIPIAAPEVQIPASASMEAEARSGLRFQIQAQLERIGLDDDWPLEVVTGAPAASIARFAEEVDASLIVVGLGQHGLFERIFGDETVLKLLRLTHVPVLAVAPGFSRLPREVLVATDFSTSSIRASQIAAELMDAQGRLTLAHVAAEEGDPASAGGAHGGFEGSIGRAFDLAISKLPAGLATIERSVLTGHASRAILDAAQLRGADLLVAGSHGHGFLTRLLIGSVSQQLLRGARCSVLVAPPEGGNYLDEVPELTTRFASYEWAERLEEFTRRNVGRLATLEVIDPEIGAQIEEKGFPFVGAAFDTRTGQVQLMLGDGTEGGRHLTRGISGVTAVQVLRDQTGRDLLLRVAHGRGQTLLTLER